MTDSDSRIHIEYKLEQLTGFINCSEHFHTLLNTSFGCPSMTTEIVRANEVYKTTILKFSKPLPSYHASGWKKCLGPSPDAILAKGGDRDL